MAEEPDWTAFFEKEEQVRLEIRLWENINVNSARHRAAKRKMLRKLQNELVLLTQQYAEMVASSSSADSVENESSVTQRFDLIEEPASPNKRILWQLQETLILHTIIDLGYNPKKLPPYQPGKKWIKSVVKSYINPELYRIRFTKEIFEKAWERLRKSGEIREAEKKTQKSK